jgi:hypothetical protein
MNSDVKLREEFLSNYDSEFVYFFNNRLVKQCFDELNEIYSKTHLHVSRESEDDQPGIIYDFMDYLEIVSQLISSIFQIEKQEANHNSIFLFGLDIDCMGQILTLIYRDEKKTEMFMMRLKKYLEPTGIKKTEEILLYKNEIEKMKK